MKKRFQLFLFLFLVVNAQAQVSKTINLSTSGTLGTLLSSSEKNTITNLTITGSIDARDFKLLRDSMPVLETLDIKDANIQSYNGNAGTGSQSALYPVNEIPQFAFCNPSIQSFNKTLKSIIYPTTATSIGNGAFAFCQSLQVVNIPKNILSIAQNAFVASNATFSVDTDNQYYSDFEGGLFNKSKNVLLQCPIPTTGGYEIPSTVDSIGAYAFYNCTNITSVKIPAQVKFIGSYAFSNCTGLLSLTTSSRPDKIQLSDYVFNNVNGSTCVLNVPFATKSLYRSASQWKTFVNITEDTHGFLLNKTTLIIPSNGGSNKTISIKSNESWTISSNQSWLQVNPANGIGNDTIEFSVEPNTSSDSRMAVVTVSAAGVDPQTITINQAGEPKVLNVTAGSLSTILTPTELSNIINLKLTGTIDARDFKTIRDQMPLLSWLDIRDVTISAYTGTGGTGGESNISYAANKIPQYGLCNPIYSSVNEILQSVLLPISVTAIGNNAFASCIGLKDIQIPDQVTSIETYAFYNCKGLRNIVLPSVLAKIEASVFSNSGLQTITIPNSVQTIDSNAFGYCSSLNSASISNSVTTIGTGAFQYCNALTNLVIGNSVTSLGNCAFQYCTSLTNVIMPNSVTILNGYVFGFCSNLTNATLSNALTSIGYATFQNCTKLKNIVIPASVTKIEYSSFAYCPGLTDIIIPNKVSFVGRSAFESCTGLTNVTLGSSVTTLDSYSFRNCTALTSISIPASVTTIGSSAFESCTGLTNVTLGSSVTILDTYSFRNCTALTSISIPASVTTIGSSAFENCTGLTSINVSNETPINLPTSSNVFSNVNIGTCVLHIPYGTSALYSVANQWKDFTNIIENYGFKLEKNTQDIGFAAASTASLNISSNEEWNASSDQSWLSVNPTTFTGSKTITFTAEANPSSAATRIAKVTITANGVQPQIITITQAASPKIININAGGLYQSLTSEELKKVLDLTVTGNIDARDFRIIRDSMPMLRSLDLTQTRILAYTGSQGTESIYSSYSYLANAIPQYAFYSGSNSSGKRTLVSIKLPSSTRSIGRGSFSSCPVLTDVVIPDSVNSIDMIAFYYCRALKSIIIPNSVTSVGDNAFYYCSGLTSVTLSDSLKTLDWEVFGNCTSLTTINFGKSFNSIPYSTFYNCTSLKSIIIPNTIITIGSSAFYSCTGLTDVTVGNSVKEIGSSAFSSCSSLTNITIPISVLKIGYSAFSGCTGLKSISTEAVIPVDLSNSSNVFLDVNKTSCTLTVPFKTKNSYANANQWKDFSIINENPIGLKLDTDTARLSAKAGNILNVSFTANTSWSFTSNDPWLHLSLLSGTGSNSISLTADPNILFTSRRTSITIMIDGAPTQVLSVIQDAAIKEIETTSGKLFSNLTTYERSIVSNMSISGSIDARDFKFMRDSMPSLSNLDLSGATIDGYIGTEGTDSTKTATYLPNVIPQYAFCNDVTSIYNINLKSIIFPKTILSIGKVAFAECKKLVSVIIPNSVKTIERSAFYNCIGLRDVSIPASVNSIGRTAFYACRKLNAVKIPESVISIGDYAFRECDSLSSINIPESVTSIGLEAFAYCKNLTSIYAYPSTPVDLSLSLNVFISVNTSACTLYVPTGSKSLYQAAIQWKDFLSIIELTTAVPSLSDAKISIYPNPVTTGFRIGGLNEIGKLTLIDMNGRVLLTKKIDNNEYISAEGLSTGIYIVRVTIANCTTEHKLLVE
jgi:hypothetical protein